MFVLYKYPFKIDNKLITNEFINGCYSYIDLIPIDTTLKRIELYINNELNIHKNIKSILYEIASNIRYDNNRFVINNVSLTNGYSIEMLARLIKSGNLYLRGSKVIDSMIRYSLTYL